MKLKSHSQTDVKNNKPIAVSKKKKKISIISMPKPNIGLLVEAYFWAELNFFFLTWKICIYLSCLRKIGTNVKRNVVRATEIRL